MSSTPTYYDLFGVTRTASAEQIRSAYLWMMKQHHPDRADSANRQRAADYAAALNRCYDVLKDPAKRHRYDAYLASGARGRRQAQSARRALLTGAARSRRSRWDSSTKGAALLTGIIVVLVAAALLLPSLSDPGASGAASAVAYRLGGEQTHAAAAPDVRDAVRLAMRVTSAEAQLASERCFAAARKPADLARTEQCVVFDDAFVAWNGTPEDAIARPAYFSEPLLRSRHGVSLTPFVGSPDSRLGRLRDLAVATLLAETRRQGQARNSAGDEGADQDGTTEQLPSASRSETEHPNFALPS